MARDWDVPQWLLARDLGKAVVTQSKGMNAS